MITVVPRLVVLTASGALALACLTGCTVSSPELNSASTPGATTEDATSAADTTKESAKAADPVAIGGRWYVMGDDGDNFLTWELDTQAGTLRLANSMPKHDDGDALYRTEPDLISGDGATTFGPVENGGTTVTVAGLAGGTGDLFDITTLPDAQPGDYVATARFDQATASMFDVEVGNGPAGNYRWYQYDANDPTAAPKRVTEAEVPKSQEGDSYTWGDMDPDGYDILTLKSGEQWQASITSTSIGMFKRASASEQWQKVGLAGQRQDSAELSSSWYFRPVDITSLTTHMGR